MKMTPVQERLLDTPKPIKLFRSEFQGNFRDQIGYTKKGNEYYEIHLNSDSEILESIEGIIIIHEVGHVHLGHDDLSSAEIKSIYDEFRRKYKVIPVINGNSQYHYIVNVAMDMEINAKYFTQSNFTEMGSAGWPPIDYRKFEFKYQESWIGYLEEIFKKAESDGSDGMEDCDIPGMGSTLDISGSPSPDPKSSELVAEGSEGLKQAVGEASSLNGEGSSAISKTIGAGTSNSELEVTSASNSERIAQFLREILRFERVTKVDSMRNYNRGTRGRNGIIYTSRSKKIRKDFDSLLIVIDVSGSMETEDILKALQAIKDVSLELNVNTKVVTWDTDLRQEFPIDKVPNRVRNGGGTDVYKSFDYARENGFSRVVLYSDFYTSGTLSKFKGDLWVGTIVVSGEPEALKDNHPEIFKDIIENSDKTITI